MGVALAGIDFCGTFAFGAGADDGVADEDDAASEAVAFGGGGFGAIALGSCPYPDAAALDASAACWAPSLSPMGPEDGLSHAWIEIRGHGLFSSQSSTLCLLLGVRH